MNDIILNSDYDLNFTNSNDLDINPSQFQEIELIILNSEGQIKQYPRFGVNITKFQNGQWNQSLKNKIREMLKIDEFTINDITYTDSKINIDAVK